MTISTEELTQAHIDYYESLGYFNIKLISGEVCGLMRFAFTVGIVVGLSQHSYERRYCYPDAVDAIVAYAEFEDTNIHPTGPWVKVKGRFKGQLVDDLNPELSV